MALQLICRFETSDYSAWKDVFDSDAEDRGTAGLSVLQLWHEADAPNTVWCLFRVNDRAKAESYLKRPLADATAEKAGVRSGDFHFVETA